MPLPDENPLLILTPRQAEAIQARLPDSRGRRAPIRLVAKWLGVRHPTVLALVARGLRRLDQQGFETAELRRQLGFQDEALKPAA